MNPKRITVVFAFLFYFQVSFAQDDITSQEGYRIVNAKANVYPKFYKIFYDIKKTETLFRKYVFIRGNAPIGSIAFALPGGIIKIDVSFIENNIPDYDDNRCVVVLYHELGHLFFWETTPQSNWNREDNEKYAFEYSLMRTKQLANNGDCLPLKTGLKFMKLRSQSNNIKDVYTRALKRLVNEQLFNDLSEYAKSCSLVADTTKSDLRIVGDIANGNNSAKIPEQESIYLQSDKLEVIKKMRMDVHDNLIIYQDKSSPTSTTLDAIYLYIVKPNMGLPILKLRIHYSSSTPLYVNSYIIKPDKNNSFTFFTIKPDNIKKASDIRPPYYYNYSSWCDVIVGEKLMDCLHKIIGSDNPKLMYIGAMDNHEKKISKKEVSAIVNVLAAYDSLK